MSHRLRPLLYVLLGCLLPVLIAATVLKLGGSYSLVDLTADVTGALPEGNGGTNQSTYTQGDTLYASAANTLAKLAKSTSADRLLCNTGTSNNPAWCQADLTKAVTGILPAANGGARCVIGHATTASATTDNYFSILGGLQSATEAALDMIGAPYTMVLRNLTVNINTAPGSGNSWIVTLRTGSPGSMSNTALTCTMSNTTTCTDASNSVTVTAGQIMTIFFDANTTVTGTGGQGVTMECGAT